MIGNRCREELSSIEKRGISSTLGQYHSSRIHVEKYVVTSSIYKTNLKIVGSARNLIIYSDVFHTLSNDSVANIEHVYSFLK